MKWELNEKRKAGVKNNFFHHSPENVPKNILNRSEYSQESFLHFELLLTGNIIKTQYIMLIK